MPAEDAIAADVTRGARLTPRGQSRADLGGRTVQKVGHALGFCIEVEKLFDGGTQFEVAGALLVQERAAQARVQFGRPLKQGFHGFGGWLEACRYRSRAS